MDTSKEGAPPHPRPKHSCAQGQINGFNGCKMVRCAAKPQTGTAHWPPEGRWQLSPPLLTAVQAARATFLGTLSLTPTPLFKSTLCLQCSNAGENGQQRHPLLSPTWFQWLRFCILPSCAALAITGPRSPVPTSRLGASPWWAGGAEMLPVHLPPPLPLPRSLQPPLPGPPQTQHRERPRGPWVGARGSGTVR